MYLKMILIVNVQYVLDLLLLWGGGSRKTREISCISPAIQIISLPLATYYFSFAHITFFPGVLGGTQNLSSLDLVPEDTRESRDILSAARN